MMDQHPRSFTGRSAKRTTRPSVRISNTLAWWVISFGGIGTIAAVLGVLAFLVYVAAPLAMHGSVGDAKYLTITTDAASDSSTQSTSPLAIGVDEYLTTGWILEKSGIIHSINLSDGSILGTQSLFSPQMQPHVLNFSPLNNSIMVGLNDGRVRVGSISFKTTFLKENEIPASARGIEPGSVITDAGGTIERTVQGQYRRQKIVIDLGEALESGLKHPVRLIDAIDANRGPIFAVIDESGDLRIDSTRITRNMLTGKATQKVRSGKVSYQAQADHTLPNYLFLSDLGDNIFLIWKDGRFQRYLTRDIHDAHLVEEGNFLEGKRDASGNPAIITAATFLTARHTLLIGDSAGRLTAWFRTKQDQSVASDGITMKAGHIFDQASSPITTIAPAPQNRIVIIGRRDGTICTVHITSEKTLAQVQLEGGQPVLSAVVAPKGNALFAFDGIHLFHCAFYPGYPEASFHAFFLPVWYEQAPKPALVWQSSAATDDFEVKLSMVPLIFGTLKATFFSLIFAVPLALLAAVYTSEFMKPKMRDRVKPVVEMMASLPSVVLGYFAAIIFAPFIEDVIPFVIVLFVSVPICFLLGAYLIQLLPYEINLRFTRYRIAIIAAVLPIGVYIAYLTGPIVENWLFAGNIRIWLSGQIGNGMGGWVIVFLPLVAAAMGIFASRVVNPRFRNRLMDTSRAGCALADLIKFLILTTGTILVVLVISKSLSVFGLDPRGSIMGTFVQRNAFVVGIVMGFAVIPIIYTIADDALSAVPSHLRAAALGAGATHWQTAVTIVVPTAMSGLFSACMIGLGRAVGETMIVLMAAGNTPILDVNPFNGFRTLAANIAVEIPEAVRNSTHYRTLFFAALILFLMTFIVNTIAEIVRLRFRKRTLEL